MDSRSVNPDQLEYFKWDKLRFGHSLLWLESAAISGDAKVLELGGKSLFTKIAAEYFPNWTLIHTEKDLREPLELKDESVDCVISMEVIEHVADPIVGHQLDLSGMKNLLAETNRVLKKDGTMFLTTPNFASVWAIQRALLQQPPMLHEAHIRELTYGELAGLVVEQGFQISNHKCLSVWHNWDFSPIENFIRENNYEIANRGDDQFLLATKR